MIPLGEWGSTEESVDNKIVASNPPRYASNPVRLRSAKQSSCRRDALTLSKPVKIAASKGGDEVSSSMESLSQLNFRELLREAENGNDAAITRLVERYGPAIRRVIRKHLSVHMRRHFDSEDFMQTLVTAHPQ